MATGPARPFAGEEAPWVEHKSTPVPAAPDRSVGDVSPQMYGREPQSGSWRLSHMMYLIAGAAVLIWGALLVADSAMLIGLFVIGGIVFLFASIMGGGVILARRRSTRQDALLSILAIAAEQEMPLAPAIGAFADQYRGGSFRRIISLADRLNGGDSVPEALARSRNLVSRDAMLMAWVGQAADRLPRALRMAAITRSTQLPIWTAIAARLSYILALLLAMQIMTFLMLYFITPRFESILRDFNMSMPAVTVAVIGASRYVSNFWFITFWIPAIEVGLLVFLPLSFLAWGSFNVPVFDRLLSRRHSALILRSIGLVVDGGKPIALGITTLARYYPTTWVRSRLQRAQSQVHQGGRWLDSLRRQRLLRASDIEVLASAENVGNLSWACFELAESAERRLAVRFQMLVQTLFPLVVMMLGLAVFVIAMAYFVPLVELITELTNV